MKLFSLFIVLSLFSFNSYAEKCEGINACVNLYTKLTNHKLTMADNLTDEMTLAAPEADLTKENAKAELELFLNKNGTSFLPGKNGTTIVYAYRRGEFVIAPIYIVSKGNMPQMFSKEGLVTLVYQAKGKIKKVVSDSKAMKFFNVKRKLQKKATHQFIEYADTNIISISDDFEYASKMIQAIMKADK